MTLGRRASSYLFNLPAKSPAQSLQMKNTLLEYVSYLDSGNDLGSDQITEAASLLINESINLESKSLNDLGLLLSDRVESPKEYPVLQAGLHCHTSSLQIDFHA